MRGLPPRHGPGGALLYRVEWEAERNHSSAIFQAVRQVLDSLEGRRLAEIVVGSGPGSYGGIRVALAVADGLSLVHGSRVAAFSSWNGLGIHAPLACVMSDARRGGWAWARVTAGVLEGAPEVLPGEQAAARVRECLETGVPVYSTEAAGTLAARGMEGVVPVLAARGSAGFRLDGSGHGASGGTSGGSGGTAVCPGSPHHFLQTPRLGP